MRRVIEISLLAILAFSSPTFAQTWEPSDWLEMTAACEAIVFKQDETVFDGLEPAKPLVNISVFKEIAVKSPDSSVVASAVHDSEKWFLCIVSADPPVAVREAGGLIQTWVETQYNLAQRPGNKAIIFDDEKTFAPVRVRCGPDGQLAAIMAFAHENNEFRVGVANRLPSAYSNACSQ